MLKCSKITVWIRFKSIIIQLQGENGIERLDVSIKEKDSDNTELLWSLNAIYSHEIWEEGRVHFKSKSTEKTYEYAVWISKILLLYNLILSWIIGFLSLGHNIFFTEVRKNLRKICTGRRRLHCFSIKWVSQDY